MGQKKTPLLKFKMESTFPIWGRDTLSHEWTPVVVWGDMAIAVQEVVFFGAYLYVDGARKETRSYVGTDKVTHQEVKRYVTEYVCRAGAGAVIVPISETGALFAAPIDEDTGAPQSAYDENLADEDDSPPAPVAPADPVALQRPPPAARPASLRQPVYAAPAPAPAAPMPQAAPRPSAPRQVAQVPAPAVPSRPAVPPAAPPRQTPAARVAATDDRLFTDDDDDDGDDVPF